MNMTGTMRIGSIGKYFAELACFVLLCSSAVCFSQIAASGDIRGTVTDTTGALIPGATVTVLNLDTGVSTSYTTDAAGLYDTSSIVLGNYTITFSKGGFERLIRGPVTVQAGLTTVNAQLTVGSATQQVTVHENVPLLQTESMEQSTTLQATAMEQMPEVGQDWENLTMVIPGVTSGASAGSSYASNPSQYGSVNGNLPYENVTLDGSTVTLVNSSNSTTPPLEDIAEVQIQTSNFTAESGIGGTQYNQISKGGTSQFHGAAYEYFQNDALDAANYGFGAKVTVPFLRYDEYGGAVGGPILKKKLFFFFNYDRTYSNSGANSGFATFPLSTTSGIEVGDFTGFPTIYDPTTQVVTETGTVTQPDGKVQTCPCVTRTSFAQEYGNGNKIPPSMISPVAQAIQALYPSPSNHPSDGMFVTGVTEPYGTVANNYYYSIVTAATEPRYFGRLDYDLSPNNRITISDSEQDSPSSGGTPFAYPIGWEGNDVENNNAQISDVWTISPRVINEFRYGFTDQLNFFADDTIGKGYPQKLGLQSTEFDALPSTSITNYNTIAPASNAILKEFTYAPSDVVTLILGKHVFKFGGEFLAYQNNATAWGNEQSGSYSFGGGYTAEYVGATGTGVPYADFLLGDSSGWTAYDDTEYGARYKTPQMFVQDDYKLKPNLTLNLGLRYTMQIGLNEPHENMGVFDPAVLNPCTAGEPNCYAPGTYGAMWYGPTHANGRTAMSAPIWDAILPRLGFAWEPMANTTVRGGFGLYDYNYSLGTRGNVGFGTVYSYYGSVTDFTEGITSPVFLGNSTNPATTNATLPYALPGTSPTAYNGEGPDYQAYHVPDMDIEQWSVAVQRMLRPNLAVEVAYVGSHGYGLPFPVDINQVPESNLVEAETNPQLARPYPNFTDMYTQSGTNNAVSNYNSLQASITQRMSSGLSFSFNYVWAHMLDTMDTSGWYSTNMGTVLYQNAFDPSANYGGSNFDVRNAFKGYVTYQLPFGIGRKYLNGGANGRIIDAVIGGWNTSAIVRVQSGTPFTPVVTPNETFAQDGSEFPNVIGNPKLTSHSIYQWYNPSAYAAPPEATFGDGRRNSVYGPKLGQVNLTLGKIFSIWELTKMEIRADANNVFNHPSFGDPNTSLYCPTLGQACSSTVTNDTSLTIDGRTMQLGARFSF